MSAMQMITDWFVVNVLIAAAFGLVSAIWLALKGKPKQDARGPRPRERT